MSEEEINQNAYELFSRNIEKITGQKEQPDIWAKRDEQQVDYRLRDDVALIMMDDPKKADALVATISPETDSYRQAAEGRDLGLEIMKGENALYNSSQLYQKIYNLSHGLRLVDQIEHQKFGKAMELKGGVAKDAFEAGTKFAEIEMKRSIDKLHQKYKQKDKSKDKGIDMDD